MVDRHYAPFVSPDMQSKLVFMYKVGNSGSRSIGIFIMLCLAVISLSVAYVAQSILALTNIGAAAFGGAAFILLHIWNNQRLLHRTVRQLEYLTNQPEDFENDLNRRLDELGRRLEKVRAEATNGNQQDTRKLKDIVQTLDQEMQKTADKVNKLAVQLHQSAKNQKPSQALNPSGKVVPLRQPAEAHARAAKARKNIPAHSQQTVSLDSELKIDQAVRTMTQNSNPLARVLHDAVKSDTLELNLLPIVDLHSHQPVYYETMLRLKGPNNQYFEQHRLAKTAQEENLSAKMDFQLLFDAIRMLRGLDKIDKKAGLLCPVTRSTLSDHSAFEEMVSLLKANEALGKWLIIEIEQSDWDDLNETELMRVANIVDLGYFLSLGGVNRFNFDGSLLHAVGFRFMKVPATALFSLAEDGGMEASPAAFSAEMELYGITIIASEIEREIQVLDLIDLDLPLGQGDRFSSPRPVKAELLRPVNNNSGLSGFGLA